MLFPLSIPGGMIAQTLETQEDTKTGCIYLKQNSCHSTELLKIVETLQKTQAVSHRRTATLPE
uniref:Uncharacterized protein n=1 Tax=Anguilla anguilla TaxID=7936 RepID=A0A0E9R257_ANGAN